MNISELISQNVNIETVRNSKTKKVIILSGGAYKDMPDGKKKLSMLVEMDGKQMYWMPNLTTLRKLALAWGENTDSWIGKVVSVEVGVAHGREAVIGTANTWG